MSKVKQSELNEYKCPKGLTMDTLKSSLYGSNYKKDKNAEYNLTADINNVWYCFCLYRFNTNPFGFVTSYGHGDDKKLKVPEFKFVDIKGSLKKKTKKKKKKKKKKNKKTKKGGAPTSRHELSQLYNGSDHPDAVNIDRANWMRNGSFVGNTLTGTRSLKDIGPVPLNLWGTSVPAGVGNPSLRRTLSDTLKYYMFAKKINRIISFQSCGLGYHLGHEVAGYGCPQPHRFPDISRDNIDRTWWNIKHEYPDITYDSWEYILMVTFKGST